MEPVEFTLYLDEKKVILVTDSEGKAGNGKVTDLDPNKYYLVEECDSDGVTTTITDVKFVAKSGALAANLTGIGRLTGTTIDGLTNEKIYRVRSAKAVSGQVTLHDFAPPPPPSPIGATPNKTVTSGVITFEAPNDNYYLDPHPAITDFKTDIWDTVKIPISPSGANSLITQIANNLNIFELEGQGTNTDYVFVLKDANGNVNTEILNNFYVLTVDIENPPPGPVDAALNVTFFLIDNAAVMTVSGNSITQTNFIASGLSLTLSGAPAGATVSWRYDGAVVGNTLSFNSSDPATFNYIIIGVHTISVEITAGGVTYSKEFMFVVTNP